MEKNIKAIGYVRVSTVSQEENPRFNYQEESIRRYAARKGWDIEIVKEIRSAKDISKRPVLLNTLKRLSEGHAQKLIVLTVDRLTRNTNDALHILEQAKKQGWDIVPLNVDPEYYPEHDWLRTFTLEAVNARYELDVLSLRTKQGIQMSEKRDSWGPARHPPEIIHRVLYLRNKRKFTFQRIADIMNKEGHPVTRPTHSNSNSWNKAKVQAVCRKHDK